MLALLPLASTARADDELQSSVPTVMQRRWAGAVSYGASTLRARRDGADWNLLGFGEFALRFRIVPTIEIGASVSGAFSPSFGFAAIQGDVRYRLWAERAWNPFVFASLGAATWSAEDGSHLSTRAGLGLERRFEKWALGASAELFWVADDASAPEREMQEHFGAWSASLSMTALYYWGSGGRPAHRHGVP